MNSEEWLGKASERVATVILEPLGFKTNANTGDPILEKMRVRVGWPTHRALTRNKRTVGQCISPAASEGGYTEIFISPFLSDAIVPKTDVQNMGVLETLTHEMIHAVAGHAEGHGHKFARICKQVGLEGPATGTRAGDRLNAQFEQIVDELGPFPHARIDITQIKKQATRLLKAECPDDGCPFYDANGKRYSVRITKQVYLEGAPKCGCCDTPLEVPGVVVIGDPLSDPGEEGDEDGEGEVGFNGDFDPDSDEADEDGEPVEVLIIPGDGEDEPAEWSEGNQPTDSDEEPEEVEYDEPTDEPTPGQNGKGIGSGSRKRRKAPTAQTAHPVCTDPKCENPNCVKARKLAGIA